MASITELDGAKIANLVYNNLKKGETGTYLGVAYTVLEFYSDPITDLQMVLLQVGDRKIVAFRGTESVADWITDAGMGVATLMEGLEASFTPAGETLANWIRDYSLSSSSTTIVGHSLGGALAQYFGATTGFETLTYNAYGMGAELNSGLYNNITNYVTISDPVSKLPGSEMVGQTYMLQDGDLLGALGHGISNFTSEESWVRGYTLIDDIHSVYAVDGLALSAADVAAELIDIVAEGRRFAIINGSMDDVIYGEDIDNLLIGGSGNDTLYGMGGSDNLQGGEGFDTYIAGDGDIIKDDDGEGRVIFEDIRLTGGESKEIHDPISKNDDGIYEGNGGTYILKDGILRFTDANNKTIVINNFKNGDLGIRLGKEQPEDPTPEEPYQHGSPLVLDLNNDGITSTFIYKTSTYFDLDNDGMKERTGWVQSGDGLLVLDKNSNGIIDNGNELFGNYTKDAIGVYDDNGFDALAKYDDNHDGMINNSDNVYKALKLWQDADSDGITDDGELKTLSELGISSINLSYVTVNALEERNSIRETSTFTTQSIDSEGNAVIINNAINDVWFDRDAEDTKSTTDYDQIADEIKSLGNVNGSGDVEDLAIAMSKDSVLVTKVEALIDAIQNGESLNSLETLTKDIIVRWSGTENITGINDWMSAAFSYIAATNQDVAIVEKFNGEGFYTNVNGVMKRGVLGAEAHFYIRDMNEYIIDKTLMSIYAHAVFGDSIADENGYIILSELKSAIQQALSQDAIDADTLDAVTNIAQIWNEMLGENASMDFIEELGLSKDRYYDQYTLLEKSYTKNHGGDADNEMFDNNSVALSGNGYGENSIFYGQDGNDKLYGGNGHDELYGGDGNDYIDGGWGMDFIDGGDGDDIISDGNGQGNDIIIGGKGNDTINMTGYNFQADTLVYRYGDGNDIIIDARGTSYDDNSRYYGNNNQIIFQNIRFEDIQIIYADKDMIINVMDAVSNTVNGTITIKNGYANSPVNLFVFDDQVLSFYKMQLIAGKLIQDDIYSFSQGEGIKNIIDYGSANGDTIQFGPNIAPDDIIVQASQNSDDIIIAIKEDGKTFDELTDKIIIKNWV